MMSASVGVDTRAMHGHDVVVNICSGFNLITCRSFPLGWEERIVREGEVTSLAGADESPLTLLGVVSLAVRFGNTAYRAHFIIVDRLAVNVLVRTRSSPTCPCQGRNRNAAHCRIIEPTTNEWASLAVLAPTKDRKLRFCVDNGKLNTSTSSDAYPLLGWKIVKTRSASLQCSILYIVARETGKFRSHRRIGIERHSLCTSERSGTSERRLD